MHRLTQFVKREVGGINPEQTQPRIFQIHH